MQALADEEEEARNSVAATDNPTSTSIRRRPGEGLTAEWLTGTAWHGRKVVQEIDLTSGTVTVPKVCTSHGRKTYFYQR